MTLTDLNEKPARVLKELIKLVALVFIFLFSTSTMIYLAMREPATAVPNLLGKQLREAELETQRVGLKLEIKNKVFDDRSPENTVVEQWPRAGMTIKKGQSLRVNMSMGPRVARAANPEGK